MTRFRIEELAAWTQIDDDDEEGVTAFLAPGGVWMPMIGANTERIKSLRAHAEAVCAMTGKPVELVSFVKVAANPQDVILPPGWPVCPDCGMHRPEQKYPWSPTPCLNEYHTVTS